MGTPFLDRSRRLQRPAAILFDVGGVLLEADSVVVAEAAWRLGIDADPPAALNRLRSALRDTQLFDIQDRRPERLACLWGWGGGFSPEAAGAIWDALGRLGPGEHHLLRLPHDPGPLTALRRAGVRLAVISNSDGRAEDGLRAAGLIGHFEFVHDSALTGRRKPNAESYERAARVLGLPLRTCWYVSDTTYDFHAGALALGLGAAIVFDPRSVWPWRGDFTYIRRLEDLVTLVDQAG